MERGWNGDTVFILRDGTKARSEREMVTQSSLSRDGTKARNKAKIMARFLSIRFGTKARNKAKIIARFLWLRDGTKARKKGKMLPRSPWLRDGTKARIENEIVALWNGGYQVHWALETRPHYMCYLYAHIVLKIILQIILLILNLIIICFFNNITHHDTRQWIGLPPFTIIHFFNWLSIKLKKSWFK